MTQTTIPKPQTPWAVTIQQRLATGSLIALGVVLAGLAVQFTGLNGKLGFAAAFFFFSTVLIFIQQLRLRDLPAAKDSLLSSFAFLGIVLTLIPIVSIVTTVVLKGYKGIHIGMFSNDMTQASVNDPVQAGGLVHAIIGTLIMVGVALVISFPIGLLTALYLTEIKGKLARPIKFLVQAMSGVPSIVAGLFIYAVWMIGLGNSYNAGAGAAALTILMIPTVARTSEEVLKLIPNDLREAGLAMGATQWRTVAMVIIPAARSGLVTAIILGVARVVGETAPLLLTVGGADAINLNPGEGNMSAFPYYVWKNLLIGDENAVSRAWTGVMVLMILVLIIFTLARYFSTVRSNKK